MRFDWGTVAAPMPPGSGSVLSDIDNRDTVNFRVKVIDAAATDSVILAQADRIRASVSEQSLLPVEVRDLGDIVWRLSFDNDEPFLLVNSRIEGVEDRVSSDPEFHALVLPSALRDVLEELCNEFTDEDDEQRDWVDGWERFVGTLTRQPIPSADDVNKDEWIDTVINSFARRHLLLPGYREALNANT